MTTAASVRTSPLRASQRANSGWDESGAASERANGSLSSSVGNGTAGEGAPVAAAVVPAPGVGVLAVRRLRRRPEQKQHGREQSAADHRDADEHGGQEPLARAFGARPLVVERRLRGELEVVEPVTAGIVAFAVRIGLGFGFVAEVSVGRVVGHAHPQVLAYGKAVRPGQPSGPGG